MSLQSLDNLLVKDLVPTDIPSDIRSSWQRSLKAGVKPTLKRTPSILLEKEIDHITFSSLLYHMFNNTKMKMEKYLDKDKHSLTLADDQGRIIGNYVQGKLADQLKEIHFYPGGNWKEELVGTNAIGTALASGKEVIIRGTHHFCEGWQAFSCAGVPIKHPILNKIAGVLDLTTWREDFPDQSLTLTGAIVQSIEAEWRSYILQTHQQILKAYSEYERDISEDIVFAIDWSGVLVAENKSFIFGENSAKIDFERTASFCKERAFYKNYEGEITVGAADKEIGKIIPVRNHFESIGFIVHLVNKNKRNQKQEKVVRKSPAFLPLIGESESWLQMIEKAQKVAVNNTSVLLTGESGTGKELLARAIHNASNRSGGPFIAINCATLTHDLSSSELFGYSAGAFTGALKSGKNGAFEEADGGTLFLDEVSEMSLSMQAMFLRVLQEREVVRIGEHRPRPIDVRIIAATNRNLFSWTKEGNFREDLYYRLNVVNLMLPSLKERKADILQLAAYFLENLSKKNKGQARDFCLAQKTKQVLTEYHWPGNVRELKNVMEYVYTFTNESLILPEHLPENVFTVKQKVKDENHTQEEHQRHNLLNDEEANQILNALKSQRYNMSKAARQLGISRSTLYRKLKRYKIEI
ncbi:sigma-54-dependent Fis family transcriptional regulator [Bacillus taeanensis]|uniref:Sigma-54-dependent Fis family transcriptional regulator n=1 Tax=Bacillus taeanensis TaxID=273032 RepID=A0A366XUE8_9BACI|nr:sigma 54-interacting transcriptional regulator [Bacillus taeanensis]RBW69286.1 sigma-54-dependent Fis family transcriptional regulator [Bacillus taeanensis]